MRTDFKSALLLLAVYLYLRQPCGACRIGSEKLKSFTRLKVERLLDVEQLAQVYWSSEPLNANALSYVTGINITLAETRFNMDQLKSISELAAKTNQDSVNKQLPLLHDIFVTCSADRDRSYTLTINLEINNPFKVIDVSFLQLDAENEGSGLFRIRLPKSTFLAQLKQRISYDECLDVSYVQLAPNVAYELECIGCSEEQQEHLNKSFSKRMIQLDAELDSLLSEKLFLGLQTLMNEQRLDLDLYLN